MKAIVYRKYGSPEVLELQEVDKPTITDNEVLIKVHAASANALDWHLMRGKPYFARLDIGFPQPKHSVLGADFAGTIEAVGSSVKQFQPGDEVFGSKFQGGLGAFAEYVAAPEDRILLKPANLTFEQAAAVPVPAMTALQGLRDKGKIQSGQKVLINGASGAVGAFAVQIAKSFGTDVTGVCSTRNLELVRGIGADDVIDYTRDDFTKTGRTYDLIFCAVGNRSAADYKRALNPNGVGVIAGFTTTSHFLIQVLLLGTLASRTGNRKVGFMGTTRPNKEDLEFIKGLLEAGKVVPVIDNSYPLSETAEAIGYLETGHARGKVVITM